MSNMRFGDQLRHAWNLFNNKDPASPIGSSTAYGGPAMMSRPDRHRLRGTNEATLIASIYNRIAVDTASYTLKHVRVDENGVFKEELDTGLNKALQFEANLDQTAMQFVIDLVVSMLDEGVVAVVPVDTDISPVQTAGFDVLSMRVAKIVGWGPRTINVDVYNDRTGNRQQITMPKERVAIIENPFYSVMNEPNSTLRRLTRKLALLDYVDDQSGSGKLNLIIQLPYLLRSQKRKEQAAMRKSEIESQLEGSKYGIAMTDGTEHIIQLNRPVDNNLMEQVTSLTSTLYSQLGITLEIMNGTADESAMLNYLKRVVEVILKAITQEFNRSFLTKTGRTQGQRIMFFRNPLELTTPTNMADLADKLTRNEILSPNELRAGMGFKPSSDPKSNELRNRNINQGNAEADASAEEEDTIWDETVSLMEESAT